MATIGLQEAEGKLPELLAEAAQGEEVIIERGDGTFFQLVPLSGAPARPRFGSARGLVTISDDFDAPLPDFAPYAP